MKKLLQFGLLSLCSLSLFSCDFSNEDENTTEIVDILNRKVEVPKNPKTFACLGPGALRQYTYVGDPAKLVGIEHVDQKGKPGQKPYLKCIDNKDALPIIGEGGPADKTNYEALIQLNPDVVFTSYISDLTQLNSIAERTGLNLVAIGYNSNGLFSEDIYNSLEMMSKVIGDGTRGKEVVKYFKDSRTELETLTENKTTETGYLGCVNFRGSHGIDYTTGDFPAFDALHITNAIHSEGIEGFAPIQKETLTKLNPDKIIIDVGGLNILKQDIEKFPEFYSILDAFKNDEVYTIMPTVFYSCNFDVALANAYYLGKVFYPEQFKNVNISEKFDEITTFLYGERCYSDVTATFKASYGKLSEFIK